MNRKQTDVPEDVAKALDGVPVARSLFDALPPSHQAEYVAWITAAKKPATRERRIVGMIERMKAKKGLLF